MQSIPAIALNPALIQAGVFRANSLRATVTSLTLRYLAAILLLAFTSRLHAQQGTSFVNELNYSPEYSPTYNEAITASVLVRDENTLQPLTGSVNFSVDGGPAVVATLNSEGLAYANLGQLAIGSHMITATYPGNAQESSGSAQQAIQIGDAPLSYVGTQGTTLFADGVVGNVQGVAVDAQDNLYISDESGNVVRKEDTFGNITAIPLTGLKNPIGLALDGPGNLYVADTGNNRVLEYDTTGKQSVVPLTGLSGPTYLAYDRLDNLLYIVDPGNSRIVMYTPSTKASSNAVTGMSALLGVSVDGSGNLYFSDQKAGFFEITDGFQIPIFAAIRETGGIVASIDSYLILSDQATNGVIRYNNYFQPAQQGHQVQINNAGNPVIGMASDSTGRIYLALGSRVDVLDPGSARVPDVPANIGKGGLNSYFSLIFQVPSAKPAFTVSAKPASTFGTNGSVYCPGSTGACVSGMYFVPQFAGVNAGSFSVVESTDIGDVPMWGKGIGGGAAFSPGLITQSSSGAGAIGGVAFDAAGNRYVTDSTNNTVTKFSLSGTKTTLAVTGLSKPTQIAVDGLGAVYVLDSGNQRIVRLAADGTLTDFLDTAPNDDFASITAFTLDGDSNLIVAGLPGEPDSDVARKRNKVHAAGSGSSGSYIVGLLGHYYPQDGNKTDLTIPFEHTGVIASSLPEVTAVAIDAEENVFAINTSGTLTRFGIDGSTKQIADGLGTALGVQVDPSGTVYVLESNSVSLILPDGSKSSISINGLYSAATFALDPYGDILLGDGADKQLIYLDRTQQDYVFGDVNVGQSETLDGAIANVGNQPFTVSSAFPANSAFLQTSPSNTCLGSGGSAEPSILDPAGSCALDYTFTPPSDGPFTLSGTLATTPQTLVGSSGGGAINLSGTGEGATTTAPNPVLTPATINFGSLTVGTTSAPQTATLQNSGNATLTISNFGFFGSSTSSFSETNNCGPSLSAGAVCTIQIACTPSVAGTLSANLGANFPSPITQQSVALTCTGTAVASPQASLTPKTASFSAVSGSTSAAQTFTLANAGTAALTINSIGLSGTNASQFAIASKTCGTSLAASASCTLSVTFSPTATGSATAILSVVDNATGSPQTSALTGTGTAPSAPAATLTPAKLDFGSIVAGTKSTAQSATLSNTGNAALTISSITLTGSNAASFTTSSNCGATLAAGASCSISITFNPTTAGSASATLSVSDDDAGSPQTSALAGVATTPPPVADFSLSATPATQTIASGSTAAYRVTIHSVNGSFAQAVVLAASGLPPGAAVSFSPSSVTPGGPGATSTMTIQTVQETASARSSPGWPVPAGAIGAALLILPFRRRRRLPSSLCCLLLLLVVGGALSACGGGFALPQQPSATYTVTVNGTSGSLQHSTSVQITVR